MAFTTTDYPKLTQKLNEVFNETAAQEAEGWIGQQVFDVVDTDWKVYDYLVMHGAGNLSRVAEGQELPTVSSNEGDSAAFTIKRYGEKVSVTKDMRMFDRYDQMEEAVQSVTEEAFQKIDQSMADVLTNGFTGTSYTDVFGDAASNLAVDGVVLFSASHTNNINARTFRNLIRNAAGTANPALDRGPIVKARSDARTYRDPNNVNRPVILDTLVVSAANEDLAERLIFTTQLPGGPDNDNNPIKGKVKNLLVWSKLDTRSDGTDTSAYWFMADSRRVKRQMKAPFAQKPMMHEAEQVTETQNWLYPLDAYYALGLGYPSAIYGSTGTA